MSSIRIIFVTFVSVTMLPVATVGNDWTLPGDWPQFRGRFAAGVADGLDPPARWDAPSGSNIRWKTQISGLGHASPIISRGCVFIVTANSSDTDPSLRVGLYGDIASVQNETAHRWQLLCLSQHTGQVQWVRTVHEGLPKIKRHTKATHANSTPATDGLHLVVFLGSEGLYCYDFCGNLLWRRDLGVLDSGYYVVPQAQWGFGSSPIIYCGMVFVQCDVQEDSFVAAFDVRDGRELWRTSRQDVPTWSTPTIVVGATRTELVVNGYKHAGAYDPWTGKQLWRLGGGGDIPVPTPVVAGELIFLSSSHGRQRPLCAVRAGAIGDIKPQPVDQSRDIENPDERAGEFETERREGADASDSLVWYKPREGIYMQTPLVYGEHLYACRNNGILSCYRMRSGERLYRERLGSGTSGFTASPVAADGRLYFTSERGDVYVVSAGPEFKLLATNSLAEICMATPAIAEQMLVVRGKNHVYGISEATARYVRLTASHSGDRQRVVRRRADYEPILLRPLRRVFGQGRGLLRGSF